MSAFVNSTTLLLNQVSAGGVEITLIIDTIVSLLFILLYLFLFRWSCYMLNKSKKYRMLQQIMSNEDMELRQEREKAEEVDAASLSPSLENTKSQSSKELNEMRKEISTDESQTQPIEVEPQNSKSCLDIVETSTGIETAANEDAMEEKRIIEKTKELLLEVTGLISRFLRFMWRTILTLIPCGTRKRDLEHIAKYYGRDMSAYIFLQQQYIYATTISMILALVILLPLNLTGKAPEDTSSLPTNNDTYVPVSAPLLKSSIYMRISDPSVLYVHLFLSIIFMLIYGFFVIFLYLWNPIISRLNYMSADDERLQLVREDFNVTQSVKLSDWNVTRPIITRIAQTGLAIARSEEEMQSFKNGVYLANPFCVSVRGIPHFMTQWAFISIVKQAARLVPDTKLDEAIVKVVLIPDLRKRIQMQQKLDDLKDKLENLKYSVNVTKEDRYEAPLCCENGIFATKPETIESCVKKIEAIQRDIEKWDQLYQETWNTTNYTNTSAEVKSIEHTNFIAENDANHGKIKPPKCSGYAVIVFRTVKEANMFVNFYAGPGIKLGQKSKIRETKSVQIRDSESIVESAKDEPKIQEGDSIIEKSVKYEVINGEGSILDNIKRLDYFCLFSLRVAKLSYEPEDINFPSIFDISIHGFNLFIRRLMIHLILIVIFVLFASTMAVTSGLQILLSLNFVDVSVKWLLNITGKPGDFVFQYLPTFLIFIISTIVPSIVYYSALWSKHTNHSYVQRSTTLRSYIYLILSTLIFPSLLLGSLDGIANYFTGQHYIRKVFGLLFVPASGSFFIEILLQKALLKNSFDLSRVWTLFPYYVINIRFAQSFWKKLGLQRYLAPFQKFKIAEQGTLCIEYEYAFMAFVTGIALTYSIFSPVVLPCALLYFLYKYFTDRTLLIDTYGHRKDYSIYGSALGFKSDYLALQKMAALNAKLMLGNIFVFCLFQAMFYGSKIAEDKRFIPHTCIISIVGLISLICIFLLPLILWKIRSYITEKYNYKAGNAENYELTLDIAKWWYEPGLVYDYIPLMQQDKRTPEQV